MSDADWHKDMLQEIAVTGRRISELEEAQRAVGLRWEPRELLADIALRPVGVEMCMYCWRTAP